MAVVGSILESPVQFWRAEVPLEFQAKDEKESLCSVTATKRPTITTTKWVLASWMMMTCWQAKDIGFQKMLDGKQKILDGKAGQESGRKGTMLMTLEPIEGIETD
jgi:hypothetical protein